MKLIFLLFLLFFKVFALNFKVASYNVENLFDLKYDKTEYKEFIPNTKSNWNKKTLKIKLNNISKVIKNIDADIVALQEIESLEALKLLQKNTHYKYISFLKNPTSAVGVGFLSKYKIIKKVKITIDRFDKYSRPALFCTFKIKDKKIHIINTHWSSKRNPESSRIRYALAIYKFVKKIDEEYIILGDLNSNYNEFQTFRFDKKLNDTDGITGINQVLNTTIDQNFISKDDILDYSKRVHFNTWLELPKSERFSYLFKKRNNTPDNMILAPSLFDKKDIDYIDKSFYVYKPNYLYKNKKINRWQFYSKKGIHKGKGFSDHLPIVATFSTTTLKAKDRLIKKNKLNKISDLYKLDTIKSGFELKDCVVIYKYKNSAIIKQKNDRAIYLYNSAKDLKLGAIYNLKISKLDSFYGLKEIKEVNKISLKAYDQPTKYFLDANKIDIFKQKYQNEIITNLEGYYKNGYFYLKKRKIRLYCKDKSLLPKDERNVRILSAHLGVFKNKPQIIIYRKKDYKVMDD